MSRQPEPPASIAKALRAAQVRTAFMSNPDLIIEVQERAVWDALLAEGEVRLRLPNRDWKRGWECYPDAPKLFPGMERVLVIPLPVVEPRDTEQA